MSQVRKPFMTRSSLACLPCRSRHQKCDAKKPQCTRCGETSRQCQYSRSRRGGNSAKEAVPRRQQTSQSLNELDEYFSALITPPDVRELASTNVSAALDLSAIENSVSLPNEQLPGSSEENSVEVESVSILSDSLIGAYYKNFHKFHPFILPRRHLAILFDNPAWTHRLEPLVAIVRLIGNLYFSQKWSTKLQRQFEACFESSPKTDSIRVQCHLLYSVVLFWHDQVSQSQSEMAKAAELAVQLKMFEKDFATEHSDQDSTLAESWRRTWWMVYIFDGFYAGTLGTMQLSVLHVDATADLPCENIQYESGIIPEPRSLREWECREFDEESKPFSSFTYLIGAVKCAALATASTLKVDAQKQPSDVFRAADSILDSWILLLPKVKKQVLMRNGDIDELMFQAHLLIHVVIIGFHRPHSDLKFNAVEDVSSCARDPAPDLPTPEHINIHTVRVLRSVEAQISLLALPSRPFNHTPFCTCMISEGTLALLSACKFLLRGTELAVARDQIRLSIGCLKAISALWPRIARNVSQIQTIARHVLGIESQPVQKDTPGSEDSRTSPSEGQKSSAGASSTSNSDIFSSIRDFEDVCGWNDIGELNPSLLWWPSN